MFFFVFCLFVLFCFLSRRLIKCFAFFISVCLFVFISFCFVLFFRFCFQKFHPPLISNGVPLSLFYYIDDGGHYVIDNFELPCNSVKNLIPIWNFTNTFIQECKIIWEFQIRWGGTSLLRPLWRSWRYLKAYSLMSNTGCFQKFKNLIFFFYIFPQPSSIKEAQFPKGIRLNRVVRRNLKVVRLKGGLGLYPQQGSKGQSPLVAVRGRSPL